MSDVGTSLRIIDCDRICRREPYPTFYLEWKSAALLVSEICALVVVPFSAFFRGMVTVMSQNIIKLHLVL